MKIVDSIQQNKDLNLHITEAGQGEVYLVVTTPDSNSGTIKAADAYTEIAAELRRRGLEIVHERIFGSLAAETALRATRTEALSAVGISPETPLTYIQGSPDSTKGLNGIIIRAVACSAPEEEVWTIQDGHIPCGRGWRRGNTSFIILQNLQGRQNGPESVNTAPIQTLRMLEQAEFLLQQQGACFHDVIRTWFYLEDILDWYDEFNKVRSAQYRIFDIMPGPGKELLLPASTGIRGSNPNGSSGALDLFAMAGPKASRPAIKQLSNTVQKDAFCYGSAFSRGALIHGEEMTMVQLSGTAAIDEQGVSLYPGDIHSQINCTFDKIEELLDQVGGTLSDMCAATAFVKRPDDVPTFKKIIAERGLDHLPIVCVVADICRDELLFEIDAEMAIKE